MNTIFELVPYKDDDYEFIFNAKKICYKKYVEENFGEWDDEAQYRMLDKFLEESKNDAKIIIVNGKRAGFTNGKVIDENNYEQGNICILPEYQNKGIGTSILKNAIHKNKNRNILLRVFKQNRAQELYKRLGFEIIDETKAHYKMIHKKESIF